MRRCCNLPVANLDVFGVVHYLSHTEGVVNLLRLKGLPIIFVDLALCVDEVVLTESEGAEEQGCYHTPLSLAHLSFVQYPFDLKLHLSN